MQEFKKAKNSEYPEKCTFIDIWNRKKNWEYFDLDKIEAEVGQAITGGTWEKDF